MKVTAALTATLFGASVLAAPSVKRQDKPKVSYEITNFTERKPDGYATETISFNIVGNGVDVECTQYDFQGQRVDKFVAETVYSCGPGDQVNDFTFSYKFGDSPARTEGVLKLWQRGGARSYAGQTSFAELIDCTKAPSAETVTENNDLVCKQPASPKITIDLTSTEISDQ